MKRDVAVLLVIFGISLLVGFHLRTKEVPKMKLVKKMEGNVTVGVLSDTHIPTRSDQIPQELLERFRKENVDLIVHAGDLVSLEVKNELEEIAPVVAVCGNMDPQEVCDELPKTGIVEINKFRIGVIHNTINPLSQKMRMLARENDLDMVIFGHTHRNNLEEKKEIYYLNPGSPTQPIMDSASYALVEISKKKIDPKIIKVGK